MRLFLALDLPPRVREVLGRIEGRMRREMDGWRWVRPEGIHLTLRFLGSVDDDLDQSSRSAWAEAARGTGAIRLRLGAPGCFRRGRTPRVLWVAVREDGKARRLERLAEAVEDAARGRGFAPASRPFRPHLTLARAARDGRATMPRADLPGIDATFEAGALTLFRSELLPGGARYTVLETFPL